MKSIYRALLISALFYCLPATAQERAFVAGRLLVQFRANQTDEHAHAVIKEHHGRVRSVIGGRTHLLDLDAGTDEQEIVKVLTSRSDVLFAEVDHVRKPQATSLTTPPNDPMLAQEGHIAAVNAQGAWNRTTGSPSIIIAIIDSGVNAVADLAPNLVPGWNLVSNTSDTHDVYGHGTEVAGAAAAIGNNGVGVAGLAWSCKIMPIMIAASDGGSSDSIIANGLTWAADHGARVANISYAVADSQTVASAAQYFQSKGGVVTVAAGNYQVYDTHADTPSLLTVSATNWDDTMTVFSNTGTNIDLSAPGQGIMTTLPGGDYGWVSGTSFSAPVVAGVAALVLSANPALSGVQARNILIQNADDFGVPGWDPQYGNGRVNALRAVNAAMGLVTPDTNTAVYFGSDVTTQGNWRGVYGNRGQDIAADSLSISPSVSLGLSAGSPWTWAASTMDVRALQKATNTADRIAAAWYGSSFIYNLKLSDGKPYRVSLYLLDWSGSMTGSQTVEIYDVQGGALLSRQVVTGFGTGKYVTWTITGNVTIHVSNSVGNAVVSGVFIDDPTVIATVPPPVQPPPVVPPPTSANSATFVKADMLTGGSWKGVYGKDGYVIHGDSSLLPAYATVAMAGGINYTWDASPAEIRATQRIGTGRVAACLYSATSFSYDVKLTDGVAHTVSLYCLDWDGTNHRTMTVQVLDASGALLDSQIVNNFSGGRWLVWTVQGHVVIKATNTGPGNAVVSGVFFN